MKESVFTKLLRKLRKIYIPRSTLYKPSTSVIILCLTALTIFILGGGIYDVMEKPLAVLPTPSNPIFYFPGISEQLLNESLIFVIFLTMGIGGGLLAFRSTSYVYRPREAKMFLLLGLTLLIIAFLGCEILLMLKGV